MDSSFKYFKYCVIMFLGLILLTNCTVNMRRIEKSIIKGIEKDDFSTFVDYLDNEKVDDVLKLEAISKLSSETYIQDSINNLLLTKIYPRFKDQKEFEEAILKALISQNNLTNLNFFLTLVEDNHSKKDQIKGEIADFDIEGFQNWKWTLAKAENEFREDLLNIVNQFSIEAFDIILNMYVENDYARKQLEYYLFRNENRTIQSINNLLKNHTITNFDDIEVLIREMGSKQLSNYIDLLKIDDEAIFSVVKSIFSFFGNEALISLEIGFSDFEDFGSRLRLYRVCQNINTTRSISLLENFLSKSEFALERKEIISLIAEMYEVFPISFIPYLDVPDVSQYILKTIERFLDINPDSVFRAFLNASNVGKNKLIKSLFLEEMASHEFLKDIFAIANDLDEPVQAFLMYSLLHKEYRDEYYRFVLYCLESENKKLYTNAIVYANKYSIHFYDYVHDNFDFITQTKDKKMEMILFFENLALPDTFSFLFQKYLSNYKQFRKISKQFGYVLMNNVMSEELQAFVDISFPSYLELSINESKSERVKQIFHLIKLSNNGTINNSITIQNIIINIYNFLEIEDRLRAINFTAFFENEKTLSYFFSIYTEMTAMEKQVFNLSLNNFKTEKILKHIERIALIGCHSEFDALKDIIYSRFSESEFSDGINHIFVLFNFRTNNFDETLRFIEKINSPGKYIQDIIDFISLWNFSLEFTGFLEERTYKNPANYLYVYKKQFQEVLKADFLINHELTSPQDKIFYTDLAKNMSSQLNTFKSIYNPFFVVVDLKDHFALQNNLLVSLLQYNYLYNMQVGNFIYRPQENKVFLSLDLLILNENKNDLLIDFRSFVLSNEQGVVYKPINKTLIFNRLFRKDFELIDSLSPKSDKVLTIYYEIPDVKENLFLTNLKEIDMLTNDPIQIPSME